MSYPYTTPYRTEPRPLEWRWVLALLPLVIALVAGTTFLFTYTNPDAYLALAVPAGGRSPDLVFLAQSSSHMPLLLTCGAILTAVQFIIFFAMPVRRSGQLLYIRRHPVMFTNTAGFFAFLYFTLWPEIDTAISGRSLLQANLPMGLLFHRGLAGGFAVAAIGTLAFAIWWLITRPVD